jgi:tryptophan 2,3-dioxygenase
MCRVTGGVATTVNFPIYIILSRTETLIRKERVSFKLRHYIYICGVGHTQVLEPHLRRMDEAFTEARVLAEVSLLPEKVRITSGRRAVAMASGVVDRSFMQGEVKKKKVFVVVTSGWSVMCFDHNLKKLWEQNLQVSHPQHAVFF